MRTTNEIIIDAKDGKIPSHEECFWAMLALSGRLHFTYGDLKAIAEAYEATKANIDKAESDKAQKQLQLRLHMHATSASKIWKERASFGNMDPQVWLGDMGNPFDPKTAKFHDAAKKILENAINKTKQK